MTVEDLGSLIEDAAPETTLKQILSTDTVYGPAILQHCMSLTGLKLNAKLKSLEEKGAELCEKLFPGVEAADAMVASLSGVISKGYIIIKEKNKKEKDREKEKEESTAAAIAAMDDGPQKDAAQAQLLEEVPKVYDEFVPFLYEQYAEREYMEFPTFGAAVDEFFAKVHLTTVFTLLC
jgi:hypothetical protein